MMSALVLNGTTRYLTELDHPLWIGRNGAAKGIEAGGTVKLSDRDVSTHGSFLDQAPLATPVIAAQT